MQKIVSLALAAFFSTIVTTHAVASCPETFGSCPKLEVSDKE